jgi:hypothetical protein
MTAVNSDAVNAIPFDILVHTVRGPINHIHSRAYITRSADLQRHALPRVQLYYYCNDAHRREGTLKEEER